MQPPPFPSYERTPGAEEPGGDGRASVEAPLDGAERRRVPAPLGSTPPPGLLQPRSLIDAYFPPFYFGLLVLVFVGSAAFLLWGSAPEGDDGLTDAELRVLTDAARVQGSAPGGRAPLSRTSNPGLTGSTVLHISTVPSGALVSIDGEAAGVTPLWLEDLPPRHHVVTLEREGFQATDTLVLVKANMPMTLSLALPPADSAGVADPDTATDPEVASSAPARASPSAPEAVASVPATPPAPTSGSIAVGATPNRVPVYLDGEAVGFAPLELDDVPAGPHTLTFFLPGYETSTVHVDVEPGEREVVDVALVPQTGTLVVVVRPWGSIYVGGVLQARETDVSVELPLSAGRHEIRVEHPELGVRERTVEVQPNRTTSAVFDLN